MVKQTKDDFVVFEDQKIKEFPKSKKKVVLEIKQYNICARDSQANLVKTQSNYISPYGMTFQSATDYSEGELLKIDVALPNYWQKKRNFINYTRVNTPKSFPVIARVINKYKATRKKFKNTIAVQTLSMDDTDEKVLRCYLEESA
ncbi:MAG: hypothetical protein OXC40_01685 [Proteobacteria bacterium]|nr:hypothetical protein [Pseudomonadota bacterium]